MEERGGRDKFWNRVMFPIMDVNNRVIGFGGRVMGDGEPKYLNSPETKIFDKSRSLYGLNYARSSREKYMLVCEGYLDVISLHQAGFTNAVASLGTAFTSQHAGILKRYTDHVVLTYDSDGAGVKAALRAIPILRDAGISSRVLNMKPYKDPDEFIKSLGADAFRQRIKEAQNSFLFELDVLKSGYSMDDPGEKTRFYQETAKKLLQFGDPLERENYLEAAARAHMIPQEELRRLVNRMGMSLGLKAGEGLREDSRGRRDTAGREAAYGAEDARIQPARGSGAEGRAGEGSLGAGGGRRRAGLAAREDGVRRSQRLLLTWLIEEPALFERIEGILTPDDFTDDLYRQVAKSVFDGHRAGQVNPADILSRYINDQDQYKEVAALFNTSLGGLTDSAEQKKAFAETVIKVKKYSLEEAGRNAKDIAQLQEIIRQQAALKTLRIPMD